jgi:protocatechuate 3,4-dioxygenase beta subunit
LEDIVRYRFVRIVGVLAASLLAVSGVVVLAVSQAAADQGVTGTVVDSAGAPVSGMPVVVLADVAGEDAEEAVWEPVTSVETDASGAYSIAGVQAGFYVVYFEGLPRLAPQYYDKASTLADAELVTVSDSRVAKLHRAVLRPGGRMAGTVEVEGDGNAEGLEVSVFFVPDGKDGDSASDGAAYEFMGSGLVGADGAFAIDGLPAGAYAVSIESTDSILGWQTDPGEEIAIGGGKETELGTVKLNAAGQLRGSVVDDSGEPLADLDVSAVRYPDGLDGEGMVWADAVTDGAGAYELVGLPAGSYVVEVDPGPDRSVVYYPGVEDLADAEATEAVAGAAREVGPVVLATPGALAGDVLDPSGRPAVGIDVTVFAYAGVDEDGYPAWAPGQAGVTGTNGSYLVDGVPAGSYKVWFDGGDGYVSEYLGGEFEEDATVFEVLSGEVTQADRMSLHDAAAVAGRVVDAGGEPLADVEVSVAEYRQYTADEDDWDLSGVTETDSDGYYTLAGLREDTYGIDYTLDVEVDAAEPEDEAVSEDEQLGLDEEEQEPEVLEAYVGVKVFAGTTLGVPDVALTQSAGEGTGLPPSPKEAFPEDSAETLGGGQDSADDDVPVSSGEAPVQGEETSQAPRDGTLGDPMSAEPNDDTVAVVFDPQQVLVRGQDGETVTAPTVSINPGVSVAPETAEVLGLPAASLPAGLAPSVGAGGAVSGQGDPGSGAEAAPGAGAVAQLPVSKVLLAKNRVNAKRGKSVVVRVRVETAGDPGGGHVVATLGTRALGKARVAAGGWTRLTIKPKGLRVGRNVIVLRYTGGSGAATSRAVRLTVAVKR